MANGSNIRGPQAVHAQDQRGFTAMMQIVFHDKLIATA
jgi:hypothetical protein